jgi:hypothetical protein
MFGDMAFGHAALVIWRLEVVKGEEDGFRDSGSMGAGLRIK